MILNFLLSICGWKRTSSIFSLNPKIAIYARFLPTHKHRVDRVGGGKNSVDGVDTICDSWVWEARVFDDESSSSVLWCMLWFKQKITFAIKVQNIK